MKLLFLFSNNAKGLREEAKDKNTKEDDAGKDGVGSTAAADKICYNPDSTTK